MKFIYLFLLVRSYTGVFFSVGTVLVDGIIQFAVICRTILVGTIIAMTKTILTITIIIAVSRKSLAESYVLPSKPAIILTVHADPNKAPPAPTGDDPLKVKVTHC